MKHTLRAIRPLFCILMLLFGMFYGASAVSAAEISTNQLEGWPTGPEVPTPYAVVMDADTNAILYDKGMDEIRYPASITKILTALVAIENSSLTDEVIFGENAVKEAVPGNARIDAKVGEVLTMDQCLHAILLSSANEVSTQVAEYIGGSVEAFAAMMNEKAASLGCVNTHFTNANGLPDENHYTTAHDMALIMQAAIQNETFCSIESDLYYTIPPTNMTSSPRELTNHHAMLFDGQWHYEGAFAGKTGYTDSAGNTLVTAARRDDMTLICVVLGCKDLDYIYDTAKLLDYGFEQFTHVTAVGEKGEECSGTLTLPKDVSLSDTSFTDTVNEDQSITRTYTYRSQVVGTASVVKSVTPEPEQTKPTPADQPDSQSEGLVGEELESAFNLLSHYPVLIMIFLDLAAFLLLIVLIVKKKKKRKK
ncbi:MAG: D-alanyl-D-alanine carboxypeptidase family protein [Fusicatenibacter sp.]|nr:D-alanyl-D-alanine carboxypeptidase [Lachnospiraceae bacterium]MDY2939133.1 D-alanyl-D-alanine carboxypeptidase family protein [Fusicatenibacter sp.]